MSSQDSINSTPFTREEIEIIAKGKDDFVFFVNNIFSKSSKHFIGGEHVDNTARFLASNQRTIRVSARNHFKSYAFYAHIMWKIMYQLPLANLEIHYFSFNAELAGYHISKVKLSIEANPFFRHLVDKKSTAQSVIRYTWDNKTYITIEPHGLIQFKRGIHCLGPNEMIVVRDPLTNVIKKCAIQNIQRGSKYQKYTEILTENGFSEITDFFVRENTDELFKVTLLNGADMRITPDHPCVIKRDGVILTVNAEKVLLTDLIPYKPQFIENEHQLLGSYELGRFVGIYCGDGSVQGDKGLQLVNNPKKGTSIFLKEFAEKQLGSAARIVDFTTYERMFIPGKSAIELVKRFVKGDSSKTKHLSSDILNMSKEFREGLIAGYVEADGTYNDVSTSSKLLATDVCSVLNSLGLHYTLTTRSGPGGYGVEWRTMYNIKIHKHNQHRPTFHKKCVDKDENDIMWMPIVDIQKSNRIPEFVYDVRVASNTHLFSLANGIITHNCDVVYVDDPFQDPENELNPTIIHKVNEIFKSNILDMPNEPDGELHCAGTPQTDEDFFFDKELTTRFAKKVLPAITEDGTALWPEWMDIPELEQKRRERTDRIFQREYLCTPVYSSEGFFSKDYLKQRVVNPDLSMWKGRLQYNTNNEVIAGFDIGKKAHPSHLSVFELKNGILKMVHHKWMDNWSYSNGKNFIETSPTQLEYLKMIIKNFNIKSLYYDNTRGEFEAFDEQGLLPKQMNPVAFTVKVKNGMAIAFDKMVERKQLMLPDDERLLDQICSVRNDLQAIESSKGHGDAFWSIGLALLGVPDLIEYHEEEQEHQVRMITTGQSSIFSDDTPIPAGW